MNIHSHSVIDVMDVILEVQGGNSFSVAVDPFETVRNVKEKVQNLYHIPISHQNFIFNGQLLQDNLDVWTTQMNRGSRIHLIVAANLAPPPMIELPPQAQPMPELQLPHLPSYEYDMFGMPPWNPLSQLIPMPYDYDPLGMPEFSSSTQLMPMPPPNRNELEERRTIPDMQSSNREELEALMASIDMPPSNRKELEESLPSIDMPPSNRKELEESLPSVNMSPSNRKELEESLPCLDMPPLNREELEELLASLDIPPSDYKLEEWLSSIDRPPSPPPRATLNVKVPTSKDRIPIETDLNEDDTVLKLKEKIVARQDMQGVPVERIALQMHSTRVELLDHQALKDCAVSDNPKIDVFMRPSLPVTGKLKVKVLPMRTTEKIEIEVNAKDSVSVLREELEKLHGTQRFRLPKDGLYFFIHRQNVMFEEQSFQWHEVGQGDTIDTFDGIVSPPPPAFVGHSRKFHPGKPVTK